MPSVIRTQENKNHQVIINLYGKDIDVTDKINKNGVAKLHMFGKDFEIRVDRKKNADKDKAI